MKNWIRHFVLKYFLYYFIRDRFSPALQVSQRSCYLNYRKLLADGQLPQVNETGFKVFSQFEEDGKLLFLFSLLGMSKPIFIEFGADDGVNSNSANLHFHFGWTGLFMDGNAKALSRGKRFFSRHPHPHTIAPIFKQAFITAENINDLIRSAGFEGEIGLLSIDIDGNDYWVWKALEVVSPQVVIIETHVEFGLRDIIVPYDRSYFYPGKHPLYHGASIPAMIKLAKHKGYRLVGANDRGFNLIFLRNDLLTNLVPEVSGEAILTHPVQSLHQASDVLKDILTWEYVTDFMD